VNDDYITATTLTTRSTTAHTLASIIITIVLSPALAIPLGLAWRTLRWAAGL